MADVHINVFFASKPVLTVRKNRNYRLLADIIIDQTLSPLCELFLSFL